MDLRIFSCFDVRHDADLHGILVRQSQRPGSPLHVVDWSRPDRALAGWEETLRRRMAEVDAVVVICGEHTDTAPAVSRELGIAQEQGKPYLLLWGRRGGACARPSSARPADSYYTWIWDVLTARLATEMRTPAAGARPS